MNLLTRTSLTLLLSCISLAALALTPVERHGALRVEGNRVVDECGRPTQLRGISLGGHSWEKLTDTPEDGATVDWANADYYNPEVVGWLVEDWGVELIRVPYYPKAPENGVALTRAVIDGAIEHGAYVLVDFHATREDREQAEEFFAEIARAYAGVPNVIYEIWNEPRPFKAVDDINDHAAVWQVIKSYAEDVIAVIRRHDPDNVVVVGTPGFDSQPQTAADDPLTTDANGDPVGNVAYTIHFYAGGHHAEPDGGDAKNQYTRRAYQRSVDAGLPLFATECGRMGWDFGPENQLDAAEWDRWEAWLTENQISYCLWVVHPKNEVGAAIKPWASPDGGWSTQALRPEGRYYRTHLREKRAEDSLAACAPPTLTDEVISVRAPEVVGEQSAVVAVAYAATQERNLVVTFQRDNDPYTVYGWATVNVPAGRRIVEVPVDLPVDVPAASDDYQFQVYIAPLGKRWADRLHNLRQANVTFDPSYRYDGLGALTAPGAVEAGGRVRVRVRYTAARRRDIVVALSLDSDGYDGYDERRVTVGPGTGVLDVLLDVSADVPAAVDAYQLSALLVPVGGGFEENLAYVSRINVDVTGATPEARTNAPTYAPAAFGLASHPNPATSRVTVRLDAPASETAARVRLIDIGGRVALERRLDAGNAGGVSAELAVELDLDGIAPGMYTVAAIAADGGPVALGRLVVAASE